MVRKRPNIKVMGCHITILAYLVLIASMVTAQEPHVLFARWHPTEDKIAVTDGYTIVFYTGDLRYIDQIILDDPNAIHVGFIQMEWSPNGNLLAIARVLSDRGPILQIWQVQPPQLVAEISGDSILMLPIAWKSDSTQFATVGAPLGQGEERVFVYDAQTGNHVLELVPPPPVNIGNLAWSPDDSQMLIDTYDELEVWDITEQPPTAAPPALPRSYADTDIAFNLTSNELAFVNPESPNNIQIWDTDTRQLVRSLQGHTDVVEHITWGSGGIISVGRDGTTRVWNPDTGVQLSVIQAEPIFAPRWNPDGTLYVTTDDEHGVHIRDAATGEIVAILDEAMASEAIIPTDSANSGYESTANSSHSG